MRASKTLTSILLVGILSIIPHVSAHTWVEQLMVIAPNGTMVGQPGFPRGNVQRTAAGFKDAAMVFLIPPDGAPINKIDTNQLMCRPEQARQVQTSDSPRLKATPGQSIALRYQENGHVTLPLSSPGKPQGGGANFVYFTTNSKADDKFLQIHRQWTPEGKGGDGRGRLISTQNFDDGQCYQINDKQISKQRQTEFQHAADKLQGMGLWCQQDIQIPTDAVPGTTVTLYWVWDWPTLPGTPGFPEGKQEIYTTCMDVDIVAANGQSKAVSKGFVKQDLANAAVSAQFSDISNPTAIKPQLVPFSGVKVASSSTSNVQASSTLGRASPTSSQVVSASTSPLAVPNQITVTVANQVTVTAPNQVTVTVRETVTATVNPSRSRSRQASRVEETVTATETDFVTVVVTAPIANKQGIPEEIGLAQPTGCSTTERAFRLRARNPFYIVPSSDLPGATAGSGC